MSVSKFSYRADIDGLRAIAVLSVLLFHAEVPGFSGGYVGVDVFFVISGYLITNVINREVSLGKFSLKHFYERRARRILPALVAVLLFCMPFSWLWMLPEDFSLFINSMIGTALFSSNFVFWDAVSYFNPIAEEQPLLHTWSLAVEEQFYIFFPFLFIIFSTKKWLVKASIFLILVISLALAEILSRSHPSFNFYLLPTRAWELMAGSLISLYSLDAHRMKSNAATSISALLGLILILTAVFFYDSGTPFPGVYAVLPVAGAMLVIAFSSENNLAGRLFSTRVLVVVGLASYSLYLWHQPLLAFAKIRLIEKPPLLLNCVLLIVALVLALLSYRFIERPFRAPGTLSRSKIFQLSATSLSLIIFFALSASQFSGTRYSDRVRHLTDSSNFNNPDLERCRGKRLEDSCVFGEKDSATEVVAWGDSHLDQLMPALHAVGMETGVAIRELAYPGCPPVPGAFRTDLVGYSCPQNAAALRYILADPRVRIVIMHSYWQSYVDEQNVSVLEGSFSDALGKTVKTIVEAGKKVLLIGPVPKMAVDPRLALAKAARFKQSYEPWVDVKDHIVDTRKSRTHLQALADRYGDVMYVGPMSVFCVDNRCSAVDKTRLLYRDDNHLAVSGGFKMVPEIKRNILKFLGSDSHVSFQASR